MTTPSSINDLNLHSADELLVLSYLLQETTESQEAEILDRLAGDGEFQLLFADLSAIVLPLIAERGQKLVKAESSPATTPDGSRSRVALLVLSLGLLIALPAYLLSQSLLVPVEPTIAEQNEASEDLLANWSEWDQAFAPTVEVELEQEDFAELEEETDDPMLAEVEVPGWMLLAVQHADLEAVPEALEDPTAQQEETL